MLDSSPVRRSGRALPWGRTWLIPLLAVPLAACGGGGSSGSSATSAAPSSTPSTAGVGAAGRGGGRMPGTVGTVAAVAASSIEVQNAAGQLTVSFTGSTAFTRTATATRSAVTVGSCVFAVGTSASAGVLTATSVTVSRPVNGRCTTTGRFGGGFGRGFGNRPGGVRPSAGGGTPSPGSAGGRIGAGPGGSVAMGTVKSVSGPTVVISGTLRTFGASSTPSAASSASTGTLTLASGARYSAVSKVDHRALKVGQCVVARGKSDSTGAVRATAIEISPAAASGCGSGAFGAGNG